MQPRQFKADDEDQCREDQLVDRFRGALLGGAIGDALGARLEGAPARNRDSLSFWISDPPEPLRYTDDTHMTLATAHSLVECRGFCGEHMAQSLALQYEREPWRGYGAGPPQVFAGLRAGKAWDQTARELFGGSGSFGNGAAMRSAPVGLLYYRDPKQAAEVAREAARITHAHPIGQDGAGVHAAAVAEILHLSRGASFDPDELLARVSRLAATRRFRDLLATGASLGDAPVSKVVHVLGNGIEAHRSVATALHAFVRHHESFADSVLFALSLGGDTDTIASTGALAGTLLGASAIPTSWTQRVEGRDELTEVADQLFVIADAARSSS